MFQMPLCVFSGPIPDEHSNRTYSLESRSLDLLENNTKISTAAVVETNTFFSQNYFYVTLLYTGYFHDQWECSITTSRSSISSD